MIFLGSNVEIKSYNSNFISFRDLDCAAAGRLTGDLMTYYAVNDFLVASLPPVPPRYSTEGSHNTILSSHNISEVE